MNESTRAPGTADPATERAKAGLRRRGFVAALLFLLPGVALVALYARALDYDYAWTDTSAIGQRTMLRPPGEIALAFREPLHRIPHRGATARQNYYRPLQVVTLSWVDFGFGSEPRNFRIAGLAIGALCLGVWALLAWKLLGSPAAALFAAVFVACHPVGIETYVWIAGISGAMSALFVISALGLALASCAPRPLSFTAVLGLLSILALVASLLSKERALVEPALLIAAFASAAYARKADSAGRGRASLDRRRAAGLAVAHLLVILVYFFGWRPVVLGSTQATLPPIGGSAATQIASALANWPANLAWLFFPLHSSTSDVIRVVDTAVDPLAWLGACLALGSAAAWWLCLRRGRPVIALGLAWIWIAYGPTAGLVPMLHANGERYLFLSAFGASLIVADLVTALVRRTGAAPGLALAAVLLAFLAQRTSARIPEWESNLTLFQHEIAREPAYREGYFLVATELFARGRFAEASHHLRTLLAAGPEFEGKASYFNSLSVHELACSTDLALGRYDAVLALERVLQRTHPGVARAPSVSTCIGQAHSALGHTSQALDLYRGAAEALGAETPPQLYVMIARNHLRLGEVAEARAWLHRARTAAGADPSLQSQIRQLAERIGRAPTDPHGGPGHSGER
jgi:tetratricopeptide (TPR) repeat protein